MLCFLCVLRKTYDICELRFFIPRKKLEHNTKTRIIYYYYFYYYYYNYLLLILLLLLLLPSFRGANVRERLCVAL